MTVRRKSPLVASLVEKIKPKFTEYLRSQNVEIDARGWLKCFNPDHNDSNPSMHIDPHSGDTRAKCFSCGFSADIFKAASTIEKKPAAGVGWVYNNVYYLADRFAIPYDKVEPTPEELLFMQVAAIYDDAADALRLFAAKGGEYIKYAEARGLTKDTCVRYGVASVPWEEMGAVLAANGHNIELCKKYSISQDMFDRDRVTFLLTDVNGMPVGFSRKYIPYSKADHKAAKARGERYPQKYYNTSSDVPFFDKSTFVYGLDTAKTEIHKRLDLYEGYFDVLMAKQCGLMSTAGTCGTSLSEYQVKSMVDLGFRHINLVFDAEPEGIKAAKKNLGQFTGYEGLHLTVMFLPFPDDVPHQDRDPDVFLIKYGVQAYQEVVPKSAFDWRLEELVNDKVEVEDIPDLLIPYILNEASLVRQAFMIKALCNKTGVLEEDIRSEIAKRTDKRIQNITDQLQRGLSVAKDTKQRADFVLRAYTELESTSSDKGVDLTFGESANAFLASCAKFETPRLGIAGWDTGWPKFNEDFDGLPKEGQVIGVTGAANCGKSAWVTTLSSNLLAKNPEGVSVIFHTLDDPRDTAFAKLMSCLTGLPIRYINRISRYGIDEPTIRESYAKAKEWLHDCLKTGRLVVKGQEMGNSTQVTTRLIDYVKEHTGNQVVYIGDSLHSLDDMAGADERIKFKRVAEWTMKISETRRMTMVFTVELTKKGMDGRPNISDLAESGKLVYAMKGIGLFYNELHDRRRMAQTFWVEQYKDQATGKVMPVKRPIIEIDWAKNKITEFKGNHYLRFYDNVARIEEMSKEEFDREVENAKSFQNERANVEAAAKVASQNRPMVRTVSGFPPAFVPGAK